MSQIQDKIDNVVTDSKEIFLAHLEGKYDTVFLPISYSSSGAVTNEEFCCYAEGTDRERDVITVLRREDNGEEVFCDDYFGIIIRDAYENRVKELCEAEVDEAKVFIYSYSVSYFDNELTADHTLDDAIAMGQSVKASKYIFFEVETGTEEAFRAACDRIGQALKVQKLTGNVKFIGLAKGNLEHITAENYLSYIPSLVKPDGEICLMMTSLSVAQE